MANQQLPTGPIDLYGWFSFGFRKFLFGIVALRKRQSIFCFWITLPSTVFGDLLSRYSSCHLLSFAFIDTCRIFRVDGSRRRRWRDVSRCSAGCASQPKPSQEEAQSSFPFFSFSLPRNAALGTVNMGASGFRRCSLSGSNSVTWSSKLPGFKD